MNHRSRTLLIALALLAGAFGAQATYTSCLRTDYSLSGRGAVSVVAGDFLDQDGDQDLAITFSQTRRLSILRNDGTGGFTEAVVLDGLDASTSESLVYDPWALVAADFNADGLVDLAGTNRTAARFFAYLNPGAGAWGAPAVLDASRGHGTDMIAVRWDADAALDLVIVNEAGNVGITLGEVDVSMQPTGSFGPVQRYVTTGVGVFTDVEVGEFLVPPGELTPTPDVLAVDNQFSQLVIWPGDDDFRGSVLQDAADVLLVPLQANGSPVRPVDAIVEDFDSDGRLDAMVICEEGIILHLHGNTSPAAFDNPVVVDVVAPLSPGSRLPTSWSTALLADIDGTGARDLVVLDAGAASTFAGHNEVIVLRGLATSPRPTFDLTPTSWLAARAMGDMPALRPGAATAFDADGDSDNDLAVLHGDQLSMTLLRNEGAGLLDGLPSVPIGAVGPLAIAGGLLDGDAAGDVIVAMAAPSDPALRTVHVFRSDRSGGLVTPPTRLAPSGLSNAVGLVAASLDDLANPDLDILESHGAEQVLWPSAGRGAWGAPVILAGIAGRIKLADVDGTASLDIVAADSAARTVTTWANDGRGVFTRRETFTQIYNHSDHLGARLFGGTKADIVVAATTDINQEGLFILPWSDSTLTHGPMTFLSSDDLGLGGLAFAALAAGEIDGDAGPEVLGVLSSGLAVTLEPGAGTFTLGSTALLLNVTPNDLALVDMNGDTLLDVVVSGNQSVVVAENTGGGTFASPVTIPTNISTNGMAIVDLDADGLPEVVTSGRFTSDLTITCNLSPGNLNLRAIQNPAGVAHVSWRAQGAATYSVVRGDLNLLVRDRSFASVTSCYLAGTSMDFLADATPAPPEAAPTYVSAWYYLVKCAAASCPESTFGTRSDGVDRFGPASVDAVPDPCP